MYYFYNFSFSLSFNPMYSFHKGVYLNSAKYWVSQEEIKFKLWVAKNQIAWVSRTSEVYISHLKKDSQYLHLLSLTQIARCHFLNFLNIILKEATVQIKTTVRYHLTLVRKAIIKKSTNNKCWRGCGEKWTLLHGLWECKWCSHCGKQYGGSLKN